MCAGEEEGNRMGGAGARGRSGGGIGGAERACTTFPTQSHPWGTSSTHLSPNSYIQPAPQWDDWLCIIVHWKLFSHPVRIWWQCCTFFQFGQSQIFPSARRYAQFGHYSVYLGVPHILPGEGHTKILHQGTHQDTAEGIQDPYNSFTQEALREI